MLKLLRTLIVAALLPAAALAAAMSGALAADVASSSAASPLFTPAQRDEIVRIVREALKNDPTILRDAVTSLQAQDSVQEAAAARAMIAAKQKDLLNNFGDPEAGNPHGDVTVVEFYDPRCPYCRRMLTSIDTMLKKDPGVRLVYKDIPVLGPASVLESRAIVAAQKQGGYLKMQAALMKDASTPSEDSIRATAKAQGLNPDQLVADMNSAATTQKIKANLDLAHALKLQGTPAFVIGDQMIPGMIEADQLEQAVAGARKHA